MKKLLVMLIPVVLIAAACGGDDDDSSGSETTEAPAESGSEATEEAGGEEAGGEEMSDLDELNVAYFAEWPTPNQYGQEDGTFGDAVGVPINWVPFGSGGEMAEAMEAGDIDIAYSQGLTPFANFVNNGADLKLVGVAVSYSEADNCIAQGSLGVTKENAAETLVGATVMTPIGNITHFKMLSMMEYLGVDLDDLNVVPAEGGATTAAAFESGEIDVGCAFGGPVVTMQDAGGTVIMTGAEVEEEIGIFTYDIVAIPASFGEEHAATVTSFLAATQEFNDGWAGDPDTRNPVIAQAAGMEDVGNFLAGENWFVFPSVEEQLSDDWMGENVAKNMKAQLETFVRLGEIPSALDDFSSFVDTSYLEAMG